MENFNLNFCKNKYVLHPFPFVLFEIEFLNVFSFSMFFFFQNYPYIVPKIINILVLPIHILKIINTNLTSPCIISIVNHFLLSTIALIKLFLFILSFFNLLLVLKNYNYSMYILHKRNLLKFIFLSFRRNFKWVHQLIECQSIQYK